MYPTSGSFNQRPGCYWQAKEIYRVLLESDKDLDWSLVEHINPIIWDNVILYGEYVIDRHWIRL